MIDLKGEYAVILKDGSKFTAFLPGTLDGNNIGEREKAAPKWHPDAAIDDTGTFTECGVILTRLTRKHAYEGEAVYTRTVNLEIANGKRLFIEVERSRELHLIVNGREVPQDTEGNISTPYTFEVTDFLHNGENIISFVCDNSYASWTHDPIVFSSAATDESQTNWNGLLGGIQLVERGENFFRAVRVYPIRGYLDIALDYDCKSSSTDTVRLRSKAFGEIAREIAFRKGKHTAWLRRIRLGKDVRLWDEDEGNLYELFVSSPRLGEKKVRFGIRTLSCVRGRLAVNKRIVFLRSETSSAIYPEEGHIPMTKERWLEILSRYRAYGANAVRFHSHCPPEAAFEAADELGIFLQPELSHWNPKTAFERDEDLAYYKCELTQILHCFANHPSFLSLSFGNELAAGAKGHKRMEVLLQYAKRLDPTRLFADGSNNHYGGLGPDLLNDYYMGTNFYEHELRATFAGMGGYLNRDHPDAKHNYDREMAAVREEFQKPVFGFEVGQYEILPDFDELDLFCGVTAPDNYAHVKARAEEKGLLPYWKEYVNATGELSLLCYREEVEASLRTRGMSGISLLSLQDFPGQGTALVGMMNAHLLPKPFDFAKPERFAAFFRSVLPLALLDRYTYYEGEALSFTLAFANYGKTDVFGKAEAILYAGDGRELIRVSGTESRYCRGRLHRALKVSMKLPAVAASLRCTLLVKVAEHENRYPVWVYKREKMNLAGVTVTDNLETALLRLREGDNVLLDPPSDEEHFPASIKAQFSTDFWSVGTFPSQSGFMGCYLDRKHPAFRKFPTENHSDWQWWHLTHHRAMILPDGTESLVKGLDSYARMRNLSLLFEARVGKGKLLVSSMDLLRGKKYPEVGAMLASLREYIASADFDPKQTMEIGTLRELISD